MAHSAVGVGMGGIGGGPPPHHQRNHGYLGGRDPSHGRAEAGAPNGSGIQIPYIPAMPSTPMVSRQEALSKPWRSGFIFFCRHDSFKETFERRIFGLAKHKRDLISQVDPEHTALFLFDQTFRYLHGVFLSSGQPGFDLDPAYLRGRHEVPKNGQSDGISPFPVQVRFQKVHDFAPLAESKFCHLVQYNAGTNVFRHRLAEKETHSLLRLLAHPEEAPRDNALPYETNGYRRSIPENPKFREQRMAAYGE